MEITSKKTSYIVDSKTIYGEGAFAIVYSCYDIQDPTTTLACKELKISLKLLKENQRKSAQREIENLLKIRHENIISLIDTISPWKNGKDYFIFEYCESDLEKELKKLDYKEILVNGVFKETHIADMLSYTVQLISAFKEIHGLNIIHRDIKPSNILISKDILKVADFGFSREVPTEDMVAFYTRSGTPMFSSPEVFCGRPFSSKCDVFSCGLVIYFMLFGENPYIQLGIKTMNGLKEAQKKK